MMLPVLRCLRARVPGIRIDLLALTTAGRAARAAGENPLGYADLLSLYTPHEQAAALALGRALLPGNTHPDIPEAESVAYLGLNALDLHQRLGEAAASALLAENGRQGFRPVGVMRRLIDHLQPDLVLATNSPRSEQAALDAAADAGLPTLALLDLFGLPGDAFAARTRHPTVTCVLSEAVHGNLVAAGWPAEAIAVTGNPAFDALHAPEVRAAGLALRHGMGGDAVRPVLLALQPEPLTHPSAPGRRGDPALPERILQAAIAAVRAHPAWRLIVRPHPSQPAPDLPTDPQLRLSAASEPLHPLLHAVDAVVTGTSTVALEAHLAGTRVLQLLDSIAAPAMPYRALGVADADCRLDQLGDTLATLLDRPSPAAAADTTDAAARVCDAALALIATRTHPPASRP